MFLYLWRRRTGLNVKRNGISKECISDNLCRKDNNVECLSVSVYDYNSSEYLEIFDIREYLHEIKCPNASPLILNDNDIYHKINVGHTNSHYTHNFQGKIICDNLWYHFTINDKIFCLPKSTTINANDYPYQIFKTKEYIIA